MTYKAVITAVLLAFAPAAFAQDHDHDHKPGEAHEAVEDDGIGVRGDRKSVV